MPGIKKRTAILGPLGMAAGILLALWMLAVILKAPQWLMLTISWLLVASVNFYLGLSYGLEVVVEARERQEEAVRLKEIAAPGEPMGPG